MPELMSAEYIDFLIFRRHWKINWSLRLLRYFINWFCVSIIPRPTHLVLGQASLDHSSIQYSMHCQSDSVTRPLRIGWIINHSDYSGISFPDSILAWCEHSLIDYWIMNRLFRLLLDLNTRYTVSLIQCLSHWVLDESSATTITPVFQYLIPCQPWSVAPPIKYWIWIKILDALSVWF